MILVLASIVVLQIKNIPNSVTLMIEVGVGVMIAIFFYWKSAKLTKDVEKEQNKSILKKKQYTLKNLFSLTMRMSLDVSSIEEQIKKNNSAMRGNINLHVTRAEGSVSAFETIFGRNFSYLDTELAKVTTQYDSFISNFHQLKVDLNNLRNEPNIRYVHNSKTILTITQKFILQIVASLPEIEKEF